MYHYAYLHGFGSGSTSFKGTQLAERLAQRELTLHQPDLNRPSFAELTYSASLEAIDDLDAELAAAGDQWRFVGSSMGGFLAARWAELHLERVDRLYLLCPGFKLVERWPDLLGDENFASWRERGSFPFFDVDDKLQPVHWEFIEDARRHPLEPEPPVPIRILHGRRDEVVPIDLSRTYVAERDNATLLEVDDDHGLTASLDRIETDLVDFFGL